MDENARVFERPRSWRWWFLSAAPLFLLILLIELLVYPGPQADEYQAALLVALVIPGLFNLLLIPWGRTLASKITVSDHRLIAERYLGRAKQIPWRDVGTVERRSHRWYGFMWRKTAIRITDGTRGGSIVFTDAMSRFSDLMDVIDERVPAGRHARMPLIWRLIL